MRWESDGELIKLCREPPPPRPFAYTLRVPGECRIPELSLRFRLRRAPVEPWMFRNSGRRAGLRLPVRAGDRVEVRSRRPGDRLRPFGSDYSRRLKDLLIDRRVPRRERDRMPLLVVGAELAWIPGVTINQDFRLGSERLAWLAELEPE